MKITTTTTGAPHVPAQTSVSRVMLQVILALIPAIAAYVWYFGPGILIQIILACCWAYLFEWWMLKWRKQPLKPFLTDYSAAVTAFLFALSIPPLAPWWVSMVGMAFAIIIAKHAYGGLGSNRFNPAMVGVAVILVSFPQVYTHWPAPVQLADVTLSWSESLFTILTGLPAAVNEWDAITLATPLDTLRAGNAQGMLVTEVRRDAIFGHFGGLGWEWIANWYFLGGIFLLWRRVIHWRIPVSILATVFLLTTPFYLFDPDANPLPLQHIFSGATVMAAFFIATDPVSGCSTPRGQLIFGIGVAVITLIIRRWGAYPDGIAFGILLMNLFAPLIDRYTRPRVFGHRINE